MKRIKQIMVQFLNFFFCAIIVIIVVANIISLLSLGLGRGIAILFVMSLILFSGVVLYKTKIYKKKEFWITLFVLGIIAKILYAMFCEMNIVSDYFACYSAAESVNNGDISWAETNYFKAWTYQIPFVYYEAFILKIFKSVRALYLFGALWSIISCFIIYKIAHELSNDRLVSLIVSSLYMWMPSSFLKIGVLYNFQIGAMFLLLGIYFFVIEIKQNRKTSFVKFFVSGCFISVANLLRQEAIIAYIALFCYLILNYFIGENQKLINNLLLPSVLLLLGYFLIYESANYTVNWLGITQMKLRNSCPYWHIVCGLTPDNNGQYCDKYVWITNILDQDKQKDAFWKIMNDIFSNRSPFDVFSFFVKKIYYMWGAYDLSFLLPNNTLIEKAIILLELSLDKLLYIGYAVLAFIGVRNSSKTKYLFMISFIGYFAAFIIKEAGVHYRFTPIIFLVITSVYGLIQIRRNKEKFLNSREKVKISC